MRLVLVHGWAGDASAWDALLAELDGPDALALDLGFYGRRDTPPLEPRPDLVAVGHSLGFLWLLHERPFAWRALISLCGMPRFTRARDWPAGVAPRLLARMKTRLAREPEATLRDFLEAAGLPDAALPDAPDVGRLAAGLDWLQRWDGRAALAADAAPCLALAAPDDGIVPPALTEAAFAGRVATTLDWAHSGGHALPMTRPAWCAGRIRAFLAGLA